MTEFRQDVYEQIRAGSQRSAERITPRLITEAQRRMRQRGQGGELRCIDVGCGEGWWSWMLNGSSRVHSVVSIDQAAPEETAPGVQVRALDVTEGLADWDSAFDLTLCLEVAEHLPPESANRLVRDLCRATNPAGIIAFSAAIPGQGGHGHLNEQWPAYWDQLFRVHGWMLTDPLRDTFWDDPAVEPWYAQNLLIGVHGTANGTRYAAGGSPRALIHPTVWYARLEHLAYWREAALTAQRAHDALLAEEA